MSSWTMICSDVSSFDPVAEGSRSWLLMMGDQTIQHEKG